MRGVQLLNKDFEFNAVSYGNLYDMAKDYDVILLAPQVSFRLSEVEGVLKISVFMLYHLHYLENMMWEIRLLFRR